MASNLTAASYHQALLFGSVGKVSLRVLQSSLGIGFRRIGLQAAANKITFPARSKASKSLSAHGKTLGVGPGVPKKAGAP
jgi:hypothetical protein